MSKEEERLKSVSPKSEAKDKKPIPGTPPPEREMSAAEKRGYDDTNAAIEADRLAPIAPPHLQTSDLKASDYLYGIASISAIINRSDPTTMRLHREYDLPMTKNKSGVWVSTRAEVGSWKEKMEKENIYY